MADDILDTARRFYEEGYVILRSVLPPEDARHLSSLVEHRYQAVRGHDDQDDKDVLRSDVCLMRMFEHDRAFRDLLALEPIISLTEEILSEDCHVVAQNALRTPMGKGIVNWHIDDALFFPFLGDLDVPDDALPLPCFSLNVLLALSDVKTETEGPTQVVARSHLMGREPPYRPALPEGITPTSLLVRAGDACLVNSQTWHRGAQNSSQRVRYLLTTTYGRRFVSQRFYPFLNYQMPPHVLDGASERLLRLLGRHEKGPYG